MLVRLASGSPRRLELLRQIGLEVDVYTSAFDEVRLHGIAVLAVHHHFIGGIRNSLDHGQGSLVLYSAA